MDWGLLPLIVTWLNQWSEGGMAGLWYPTVFLASGTVVALLYFPETNHQDLHT